MSEQKAFFNDRLAARVKQVNSLLCVGLDPQPDQITSARGLLPFCQRIIDATRDTACIYKPNSAFFEIHGPEGMIALKSVISYIRATQPDALVLLDAKRGDIDNTAMAYARTVFEQYGADAVTVNPYMGWDSVGPFTTYRDRGVFVLCYTSNPGAQDFQALPTPDEPLFAVVARKAQSWGARSGNLGLVVGATAPAAIRQARLNAPDMWMLVPGIGAQGGQLGASLAAGIWEDGGGMLISASRSIANASDPGKEAAHLRDSINQLIKQHQENRQKLEHRLAIALAESGCVRFGKFKLKSGAESPVYLDLRRLVAYPSILNTVAVALSEHLRGMAYDHIAALPYAALPIGAAVALQTGHSLIYPRREAKEYGTKAEVEGVFKEGDTAVILDDLATTGESKFEAISKLKAAGLIVRDVLVVIDREQGAKDTLASRGYRLHALTSIRRVLEVLHSAGQVSQAQYDDVMHWLADNASTSTAGLRVQ
jgi:uridine monophosphate synthetase